MEHKSISCAGVFILGAALFIGESCFLVGEKKTDLTEYLKSLQQTKIAGRGR
jgi:hypothetical protein